MKNPMKRYEEAMKLLPIEEANIEAKCNRNGLTTLLSAAHQEHEAIVNYFQTVELVCGKTISVGLDLLTRHGGVWGKITLACMVLHGSVQSAPLCFTYVSTHI